MCMITYLPPFVAVPEKGISNGAAWNDDGHGWAVAASIGLMITGHYMDSEEALRTFTVAREAFPEAPALFHSRWATHGTVNTKNVHPFRVGGNRHVVVAHNGILPSAFHPGKKDTRSDTAIMAQEWLADQSRGGTWTRKERKRIGNLIGSGNKLVILSADKHLTKPRGYIVNPDAGYWENGAWFSNGDYRASWTRGRWYSGGSITVIGGKSLTSTTSGHGKGILSDECPFCFSKGSVDYAGQWCTFCHMCLDCSEPLDECMCFMSAAAKAKASQEAEEARGDSGPMDDPEEAYRALSAAPVAPPVESKEVRKS